MSIGKPRGFTLMELTVVMAVIAILVGIAAPNYSGYKKRAQEAAIQVLLMEIASREREYKAAQGLYLPCGLNPDRKGGAWRQDEKWKALDFSPAQDLYGYQLKVETVGDGFMASAVLDGREIFSTNNATYGVIDRRP